MEIVQEISQSLNRYTAKCPFVKVFTNRAAIVSRSFNKTACMDRASDLDVPDIPVMIRTSRWTVAWLAYRRLGDGL